MFLNSLSDSKTTDPNLNIFKTKLYQFKKNYDIKFKYREPVTGGKTCVLMLYNIYFRNIFRKQCVNIIMNIKEAFS